MPKNGLNGANGQNAKVLRKIVELKMNVGKMEKIVDTLVKNINIELADFSLP